MKKADVAIKIRKIEKTDLSDCAAILEASYGKPPHNENFQKGSAIKYIESNYHFFGADSFVATIKGKVVAFIFVRVSAWSNGPQAILEEIAVAPEFQGKGLGQKLTSHSYIYLQSLGVKSVMLWTRNDKRLADFYGRQGYRQAPEFMVMFKDFK